MKDTKARLCPPVRSNLPHEVEQGDEKFFEKKSESIPDKTS